MYCAFSHSGIFHQRTTNCQIYFYFFDYKCFLFFYHFIRCVVTIKKILLLSWFPYPLFCALFPFRHITARSIHFLVLASWYWYDSCRFIFFYCVRVGAFIIILVNITWFIFHTFGFESDCGNFNTRLWLSALMQLPRARWSLTKTTNYPVELQGRTI